MHTPQFSICVHHVSSTPELADCSPGTIAPQSGVMRPYPQLALMEDKALTQAFDRLSPLGPAHDGL